MRVLLSLFLFGLVVSGVTAFPIETELSILGRLLGLDPALPPETYAGARGWLATVTRAVRDTNENYPFLAYGTDWLAFGHLAIAIAFIGPLRDPVRNVWVLTFGLVVCVAVIPTALIAGAVREIPLPHRLVDCLFGVFGFLPLWFARNAAGELESLLPTTVGAEAG